LWSLLTPSFCPPAPPPADLSFNRIKKIENLGHLKALRDLTLFSNEITVVEGLGGLDSLQVLSVGHNLIVDPNAVLLFRPLPKLEALTLEGNPLCKPAESSRTPYTMLAHAFLPRLKYLDNRMITAAEMAAARDGGVPAEKLSEVEEKSAVEDKAAAAAAERAARITVLSAQNLEVVMTCPGELFADEPEFSKLLSLSMPGLQPLVSALGEALAGPSTDLVDLGGDKDKRIREEEAQFLEAVAETVDASESEAAAALDAWFTALKQATRDTQRGGGAAAAGVPALVARLVADISAVADDLLRKEIDTHESVEAMMDVYESAIGELKGAKLVLLDVFFRALENRNALFTDGLQKHGA
jgi:hypothetical protein